MMALTFPVAWPRTWASLSETVRSALSLPSFKLLQMVAGPRKWKLEQSAVKERSSTATTRHRGLRGMSADDCSGRQACMHGDSEIYPTSALNQYSLIKDGVTWSLIQGQWTHIFLVLSYWLHLFVYLLCHRFILVCLKGVSPYVIQRFYLVSMPCGV